MTMYKYSVECQDMDQKDWTPTTFEDLNCATEFAHAMDQASKMGLKFKGTPVHTHRVVWVKQPEPDYGEPNEYCDEVDYS